MNKDSSNINELKAAKAFSKQSAVFDEDYGSDAIINYKRERVRQHLAERIPRGSSILELNCGTGEDALYFANEGHSVHATDISEGMLSKLKSKVSMSPLGNKITFEQCSYHQLENLKNKGPFDLILSNFGGLNCTADLHSVFANFHSLSKPGGIITLVVIAPFCLWELLLLFKGQLKTATRRFFSSKGRNARVEGVHFHCWYHSPARIITLLDQHFEVENMEGLCSIVPPSYLKGFAEKYPKTFRFLVEKENLLKKTRVVRNIGDYFIISLRRKDVSLPPLKFEE